MPRACPSCGEENPERARFCLACASPLDAETEPAREQRKVVTIVFSDLAGSTSLGERLDSESLRKIMVRYYAAMREALEAHGGTVEKFIGDAVMAVFGVPTLHEDDALRAVRAAWEMGDALEELNAELESRWGERLVTRTGVNTGEVVAGDVAHGDSLAVGDAVNVAARFEQAAGSGEILIGATTHRLVRGAVEAEAVESLELKGKSERIPAFRLISLLDEAPGAPRQLDSPLVGREGELRALSGAFERVLEERTCRLATLLGPAGVGKSRLCREFLEGVGERATVLSGRCLPYGESITYWPLVEVIRSAASIKKDDSAEEAEAKIAGLVPSEDGALIASRVAGALGLSDTVAEREDTFRALRRLIEALAAERPLIIAFDDIQWGGATFLDLVEYLAGINTAVPLLLLCLARPELRDTRPKFASKLEATTELALDPLDPLQSRLLMENLLGEASIPAALSERIAQAAQGNPLFVEEMLREMVDDGRLERQNGSWRAVGELSDVEVPATVQAILAARLGRLQGPEREVIERAAVIGEEFWSAAVSELTPAESREVIPAQLDALVVKELVRRGGTTFLEEEGFRFSHLLVRDVAYSGMLKEIRAELHELLAAWLEERAGERDEIIGYHLEQAYRYRIELGPADEHAQRLARRAGGLLGKAGLRADARGDAPVAANLLERATSLLPSSDPQRPEFLLTLGVAFVWVGELDRALDLHKQAGAEARAVGNRRVELLAGLWAAFPKYFLNRAGENRSDAVEMTEFSELCAEAVTYFTEVSDDLGLSVAYLWLGNAELADLRLESAAGSFERALAHARRAGRSGWDAAAMLGVCLWHGPVPVEEAIRRLEELGLTDDTGGEGGSGSGERAAGPAARLELAGECLAPQEAMRGNFERARQLCRRREAFLEEFGLLLRLAEFRGQLGWRIEMQAGDLKAAERVLRLSADALREFGDAGNLTSVLPDLAQVLFAQGRYEEAEAACVESRDKTYPGDVHAGVGWRAIQAKLLARRGESEGAESLAREAVAMAERTDAPNLRAGALLDLARVLRGAQREEEAIALGLEALSLYEAKGNLVGARDAGAFLKRHEG